MAVYEIDPMANREVVHGGSILPMGIEIYPTRFQPGIITSIGETALSTDDEDVDIIRAAFGDLVE